MDRRRRRKDPPRIIGVSMPGRLVRAAGELRVVRRLSWWMHSEKFAACFVLGQSLAVSDMLVLPEGRGRHGLSKV